MEQSSLLKCGTSSPDLFFTVKNRSTRFTFNRSVPIDSSSGGRGGALLTGGASGEGTSCPHAAAVNSGRATRNTARKRETRISIELDGKCSSKESSRSQKRAASSKRA